MKQRSLAGTMVGTCCAVLGMGLIFFAGVGCTSLKVDVQQPTAVERSAKVVVLPLCASATLHDKKFNQEELTVAKEDYRRLLHRLLVAGLSRELDVVSPGKVTKCLKDKKLQDVKDLPRSQALIVARAAGGDIAVWGQVKVVPYIDEGLFGMEKRYDAEAEVLFIDVWNTEELAEVRLRGTRDDIKRDFERVLEKIEFHPGKRRRR